VAAIVGFAGTAMAAEKVHLDHWGNGGSPQTEWKWRDGNLHWTNSTYTEGDSVPTRLVVESLANGSTHTLSFEYTTTKVQAKVVKHAMDYLTTFNAFIAVDTGKIDAGQQKYPDPCLPLVQGGFPAGCTPGSAPTDSAAIPLDDNVEKVNGFIGTLLSNRDFKIWNAVFSGPETRFDDVVFGTKPDDTGAPAKKLYTDTTRTGYTVTFTVQCPGGATSCNVVMALGTHLAKDSEWSTTCNNNSCTDQITGNSSKFINGAPYHMRFTLMAGSVTEARGFRDRSVMIMQRGGIRIIKECENNGHPGFIPPGHIEGFPFDFLPPGQQEDFPRLFPLTCDEEQGVVIEGGAGTYTITETKTPGWKLKDITTELVLNGKIVGPASNFLFDKGNGKASFAFFANDQVRVHVNNEITGFLTLTKVCDPSDDNGVFDLYVDGVLQKDDATCGQGTGQVEVPRAVVEIKEVGQNGTDLSKYASTLSCGAGIDVTGPTAANPGLKWSVDLSNITPAQAIECTMRNTVKPVVTLTKVCNPSFDLGRFTLAVGGTSLTNGTCDGVSSPHNVVGPVSLTPDSTVTISETGGTDGLLLTNLGNYNTLLTCSAGTLSAPTVGTNTISWSLDLSGVRGAVSCTMTNTVNNSGWMTGGGSILTTNSDIPKKGRITHGFELHCDYSRLPNNLEINWGDTRGSHKFKLDSLYATTYCYKDAALDASHPNLNKFNTYVGHGTGSYDGVSGYSIDFIFTDAGEPGKDDTAQYKIFTGNGIVIQTGAYNLEKGNHQAHSSGNK
jgi:hypothetical protein